MKYDKNISEEKNTLKEDATGYEGFVSISEDERLLKDALRPGIEKLSLFTKMLRRNAMFDKAVISSKDAK